ncbi:MAG: PilZ domain-containing protein [Pseudohongiellaceae bacterium]
MPNERRAFPKIAVDGRANLLISGALRQGTLRKVSPSGIEMECRHHLVERMSQHKRSSGLYPNVDLEFALPKADDAFGPVRSSCNVSYCRRLSQDTYRVGLNFVTLTDVDEKRVSDFIHHTYTDTSPISAR